MKKQFFTTSLLIVLFLQAGAQKKNYFSLESGSYYGNANKNIASGMTQSGFTESRGGGGLLGGFFNFLSSFGSIFGDDNFTYSGSNHIRQASPREDLYKIKYRIRAGHYLNTQTAIEAGFGLTFYGSVSGQDIISSGSQYNNGGGYYNLFLTNDFFLTSRINTLYVSLIKNNVAHTVGFGAGPAFSLYKLSGKSNNDPIQTKNYLLPGGMVTGFWNFLSKKSWFVGLRAEMSLTLPLKIDEMKVTNPSDPSFISTFKSMKAGNLNRSITLNAGIKF